MDNTYPPDPILGEAYSPEWTKRKRMKWGTEDEHMNIFTETPFGTVELLDFYKNGTGTSVHDNMTFAIKMEVLSGTDASITVDGKDWLRSAIVEWYNCPAELATQLFGISIYEQTMWGEY
jgi:hypothetical protein